MASSNTCSDSGASSRVVAGSTEQHLPLLHARLAGHTRCTKLTSASLAAAARQHIAQALPPASPTQLISRPACTHLIQGAACSVHSATIVHAVALRLPPRAACPATASGLEHLLRKRHGFGTAEADDGDRPCCSARDNGSDGVCIGGGTRRMLRGSVCSCTACPAVIAAQLLQTDEAGQVLCKGDMQWAAQRRSNTQRQQWRRQHWRSRSLPPCCQGAMLLIAILTLLHASAGLPLVLSARPAPLGRLAGHERCLLGTLLCGDTLGAAVVTGDERRHGRGLQLAEFGSGKRAKVLAQGMLNSQKQSTDV